jgi:acetoacetyl-CoA synthetase
MPPTPPPAPLWSPSPARAGSSRIRRFIGLAGYHDYRSAWEWSVGSETMGSFWRQVGREFEVPWAQEADEALVPEPNHPSGARWFPAARLNYAEFALRSCARAPEGAPVVISLSQTRPPSESTVDRLRHDVAGIRAGLLAAGVRAGDRVAGYLPNIPEALTSMLAAASLGAIWTSCAPEMGVAGVLDRLGQIEPKVLIAVDGYVYGERQIDRRGESDAIRAGLGPLGRAVWLGYLDPDQPPPPGWTSWADFTGEDSSLEFEPVPFDHPLYILYSSGTTGKPKPIVHGHGGIALEHAKALGLHFELGPGDRFFWYTTTGWMMWNFLVSGLLVGATVVLMDGDPSWPRDGALWGYMADTGTTCGGLSAGYIVASRKAGLTPSQDHDLSRLKTLGATGSPLPPAGARWVYEDVASDTMLASFSGGTDVCTGFVGTSALHPVWAGEISCACLGAPVRVFDDDGRPVIGQEGELVLTGPMPSMPVAFWGDGDGRRYRAAYFERFPGVWAHGDRATESERGTFVISGRSDGTLNRGGVRLGTAEFYSVVESLPAVSDSLVVHVDDPGGGPGELWLFVVEREGTDRSRLVEEIRSALRRDLSPRHVPDHIVAVPDVPRTLSGKKLEVPVKRILSGAAPDEALTLASLANPESIEPYVELARKQL